MRPTAAGAFPAEMRGRTSTVPRSGNSGPSVRRPIAGPVLSLPGLASYPPEPVAKILVIDAEEKTQVPFLRGILTRSLQDAGVSFETAYSLASCIREDLDDSTEVTTRALQALVIRRLRALGDREQATTYSRQRRPGGPVMVEDADGRLVPFSRARHERRLACCGLSVDEAGAVTQLLYRHLLTTGPKPAPPGRALSRELRRHLAPAGPSARSGGPGGHPHHCERRSRRGLSQDHAPRDRAAVGPIRRHPARHLRRADTSGAAQAVGLSGGPPAKSIPIETRV